MELKRALGSLQEEKFKLQNRIDELDSAIKVLRELGVTHLEKSVVRRKAHKKAVDGRRGRKGKKYAPGTHWTQDPKRKKDLARVNKASAQKRRAKAKTKS